MSQNKTDVKTTYMSSH